MTSHSPQSRRSALGGGVVVTGGGSGIGRAAVLACAQQGATIAVLDVDGAAAEIAAAEARESGAPVAVGLPCDIRDDGSVSETVGIASERVGPLQGLVTSAGIFRTGLVHELEADCWLDVLTTNLTGTFFACKHVLARMLVQTRRGSIVCVSS